MKDKNKFFTNLLVYGFLIFFGVQIIRMINNVFIAHQENVISSQKVASTQKESIKNTSNKSPSQNYQNPAKDECSFSEANYKSTLGWGWEFLPTRYCINSNTKEIIKVDSSEDIEYIGKLGRVFRGNYGYLMEYRIESIQLVEYSCQELRSTRSCNGQSTRRVIAIKEFNIRE